MNQNIVRRTHHRLQHDPSRVIAKPYVPGEEIGQEIGPGGQPRARLLMQRILAIPEAQVGPLLAQTMAAFSSRHKDFEGVLERHFELVAAHVGPVELSPERRLLIGAYFTHEYSVEGAALFNPSMVPAPDQTGLRPGDQRFIMSLRAVGEGHISSIEFRTGVVDAACTIVLDPPGFPLVTGRRTPPSHYEKRQFHAKLVELGVGNELAVGVLERLSSHFTGAELEQSLAWLEQNGPPHAISYETAKIIRVLAASNYITSFAADSNLSERVIFPAGPYETHGMEDARFVRFTDDDGSSRYYATYTAFDGFEIMPQLIETDDFAVFAISTLRGAAAQNKGMALFPRRIKGNYVMLSRRDRENLHLSVSTDVSHWNDVFDLHQPREPWELLQIGNCGSPIETREGWLVLTHGVGPMRQYVLDALLLDLDDPVRVIGRLNAPLLSPNETEREGYVPNVLYTCGGMVHGDDLILPYGMSDAAVGIATISIPNLVAQLRAPGSSR